MSAFMCSSTHLATLANALLASGLYVSESESRECDLYALLYTANVDSLITRYGSRAADMLEAGDVPRLYTARHREPEARSEWLFAVDMPGAAAILKLIDCYAYQACEADTWEASEAHKLTQALADRLRPHVHKVLWEAAPWGI